MSIEKEIICIPFKVKGNSHYNIDPSNTVITKNNDEEYAIGSKDYLIIQPGKISEYKI